MSQTEAEKQADERQKRLLKYYTEAPDPRSYAVAVALLTVGVCLAIAAGVALLLSEQLRVSAQAGIVVAIVSAAAGLDKLLQYRKRFSKSHPRPSDVEMDTLFGDELTRIRSTALEKLAITNDDIDLAGEELDPLTQLETGQSQRGPARPDPLLVFGPDDDARAEIGADGLWRFSKYHVMVICPTHFSLGLYVCIIDMLTGATHGEGTWEYHYDDVVAISTIRVGEHDPHRSFYDKKFYFARAIRHELKVTASSGDGPTIPVVTPGHGRPNATPAEWAELENVINSVRRVVRDRKGTGHLERM